MKPFCYLSYTKLLWSKEPQRVLCLLLVLCLSPSIQARPAEADTLRFYSAAFDEEREVYLVKPPNQRYRSPLHRMPLIILLDGQHDWLIEPASSDIRALQRSYEIPEALVLIVPHKDRNAECGVSALDQESAPLLQMLLEDLPPLLAEHGAGDYWILEGHSMSASFALYAFLKHPDRFAAVLAHSPMHLLAEAAAQLAQRPLDQQQRMMLSIGGMARDKDIYHRVNFESVRARHPELFAHIQVFEADHSAHNTVPLLARPVLLSYWFRTFSSRFNHIAEVDSTYTLLREPDDATEELAKIRQAAKLGTWDYLPELSDIYGILSRYMSAEHLDQSIALLKWGIELFPYEFELHATLAGLLMDAQPDEALILFEKALFLLQTMEQELPEFSDYRAGLAEIITGLKDR